MKKILVVDDNPDIVDLIKIRLEANNYEVISSPDGKDGILKAHQEKPDLVIMDVMMPHMQGSEAVRFLKTSPLTKGIPIIFLTAITSSKPKGADAKGINVDGQFFTTIAKPFQPDKLLLEIKKLIGEGGHA
ncbi:MAG: response regulator [Candidatus Omnitrophica bacterium]|nr:response regulator [Candidatus Omnitrophota bacterium]